MPRAYRYLSPASCRQLVKFLCQKWPDLEDPWDDNYEPGLNVSQLARDYLHLHNSTVTPVFNPREWFPRGAKPIGPINYACWSRVGRKPYDRLLRAIGGEFDMKGHFVMKEQLPPALHAIEEQAAVRKKKPTTRKTTASTGPSAPAKFPFPEGGQRQPSAERPSRGSPDVSEPFSRVPRRRH